MNNLYHNHYDTCNDNHNGKCAPNCDDQIPIMASVSRGLQGNSFRVDVHDDTDGLSEAELLDLLKNPETAKNFNFSDETFLEGLVYDEATKTWASVWDSENINGGRLHYQYNLRPHSSPQTFTLTFVYRRPGQPEWAFTTPPIPYLWDVDGDGKPDVDGVVGAGIGNLFLRESANAPWVQTERHGTKTPVPPQLQSSIGRWGQLNWPEGMAPKDFNGVAPDEAWAATATFGWGGDVPLPNLDDIAKIVGVTRTVIENILDDVPGALAGSDNVKDYIDDKDKELFDHFHDDLGFPEGMLPGDEGSTSVKKYIDDAIADLDASLRVYIDASFNKAERAISDILGKVYGGGTMDPATGAITWPNTDKIAVGNMNLYAGGTANWIKTDADGENDLKAE